MSLTLGFPGASGLKNLPANAGDARDAGLIPGLGRSPGEGNGNPLQYSCLESSMDRRAWSAAVPGVAESQKRLSSHEHKFPNITSSFSFTGNEISMSQIMHIDEMRRKRGSTETIYKQCKIFRVGIMSFTGVYFLAQVINFS